MEELLKRAAVIRDETEDNLNTAQRVGSLFVDVLLEIKEIISTNDLLVNTLKFSANKDTVNLSFDVRDLSGNISNKKVSIPIVSDISAGILTPGQLTTLSSGLSSLLKKVKDIETTLSKASLFNNLGVITNLSDLNGVGKPGYYTYSKRLNGHETINGLLIVSRVGFGGSSTTLQLRYELGQSYRREFDVVSGDWKEWEEVSGRQLKELGKIPMSGLDNPELETGIYLYLSEDNAPGMLYVNHPASNTIGCEQHRIFRGQIYSRLYNKRNGAWTAWSSNDYVTLDQLDTLTDPLSTISSYTVYYQNQKIGILQCFTNSRADIVTQNFDGNWDIDVTGNLLSDCYVTEPRSLVRTYNISSDDISGEIPVRTWGRWHYNQKVIKPSGGIIIE